MRTAGHITGVTVHMVTASPLTATPTLATAIPVAMATATETKGTTATTKGIATAATKGTAMAETEGTATAITGYRKRDRYRGDAVNKWRLVQKLLLFEIVRVLMRCDHAAGPLLQGPRTAPRVSAVRLLMRLLVKPPEFACDLFFNAKKRLPAKVDVPNDVQKAID
jgi:hypothetical protein